MNQWRSVTQCYTMHSKYLVVLSWRCYHWIMWYWHLNIVQNCVSKNSFILTTRIVHKKWSSGSGHFILFCNFNFMQWSWVWRSMFVMNILLASLMSFFQVVLTGYLSWKSWIFQSTCDGVTFCSSAYFNFFRVFLLPFQYQLSADVFLSHLECYPNPD